MPFLGNQPSTGYSTIVKDDFTANGNDTVFTLSRTAASANSIAVFVGNVRQEPTDAYTVNGTTLTMSAAPANGANFYVLHISGAVENSSVPASGTIGTSQLANNAVHTGKIADNQVTTAKIADDQITSAKLANAINITSGNSLTIDSGATVTNNGTATGFGKVLQVVSTFKNDTWSSAASDSYQAITGLSASITPSSTSNKVLIILSVTYGVPDNVWPGFKISRDAGSSFIAIANNDGSGRDFTSFAMSFSTSVDQEFSLLSGSLNYLDSPSTTSAVTYQVYAMGRTGFGSVYLNRTQWDNNDIYSGKRGVSSITLMEIAG